MDTVPLLDVVRTVEAFLDGFPAAVVYTHHGGDLNVDHRIVHQAALTACRPQPGTPVRAIYGFEVPSSTEWQAPMTEAPFMPNTFVDISNTLDKKLAALKSYKSEMKPWPHSRSIKAVEHLARWRGASAGFEAAETFFLARELR